MALRLYYLVSLGPTVHAAGQDMVLGQDPSLAHRTVGTVVDDNLRVVDDNLRAVDDKVGFDYHRSLMLQHQYHWYRSSRCSRLCDRSPYA